MRRIILYGQRGQIQQGLVFDLSFFSISLSFTISPLGCLFRSTRQRFACLHSVSEPLPMEPIGIVASATDFLIGTNWESSDASPFGR